MPLLKITIAIFQLLLRIAIFEVVVKMDTYAMCVHADMVLMSHTSTTETLRSIITLEQLICNSKVLDSAILWKELPTISKWCQLRNQKELKLVWHLDRTQMAVVLWNQMQKLWSLRNGPLRSINQFSACPCQMHSKNQIKHFLQN